MTSGVLHSWGNILRDESEVINVHSRFDLFPKLADGRKALPYGNGRSYGDSCLNSEGVLLRTRSLDRFISFDHNLGILTCEAGVLLEDILHLTIREGWFPAVVPGTQFVTVGGLIANDVHGKNHHRAGTFGCHVRRFELLRSTGERLVCTPNQNEAWFRATIGGLGLTGIITWAELQLRPVPGPWMEVQSIRFGHLHEFLDLCAESDRNFEYCVAWIDCSARGKNLGRGLLQRANHASQCHSAPRQRRPLSVPFTPPISLVNAVSVPILNQIIYRQQRRKCESTLKHFRSFFFPLDRIHNWNRIYGRRGFHQYQCVIPEVKSQGSIEELLSSVARSGLGSFLTVLKRFGRSASPGMLSFPLPGVTLAIDFPNYAGRIEKLFRELDDIVSAAGGRLYPAKDSRMPLALFRAGYRQWFEFTKFIDPHCSSNFWRRVGEELSSEAPAN